MDLRVLHLSQPGKTTNNCKILTIGLVQLLYSHNAILRLSNIDHLQKLPNARLACQAEKRITGNEFSL